MVVDKADHSRDAKLQYDVLMALYESDPVSIGSASEVRRVVHEEFIYFFGNTIAGGLERYTGLSITIWSIWCEFNQAQT